jgi:AcrR family transcriptional regulator
VTSPQKRRTQQERSSESRQLVLDAAVACLIEGGYASTTTLAIQKRANMSRGRMLYQFPSREALLVAAAQHLAETQLSGDGSVAVAALNTTARSPKRRIEQAIDLLWETFHEPLFWAASELWIAARTDAELRAALLPEERRLGAAIRAHLDRLFGDDVLAHRRWADVREVLFTSMRGVALTYAFDNERDFRHDPHLAAWKRIAVSTLT